AEQDVARVPHVGNARVPKRADVDGVESAQHRVAVGRQADARLEEVVGAVRQHFQVECAAEHIARSANDLDGFRSDIDADAITGNNGYAHWVIGWNLPNPLYCHRHSHAAADAKRRETEPRIPPLELVEER